MAPGFPSVLLGGCEVPRAILGHPGGCARGRVSSVGAAACSWRWCSFAGETLAGLEWGQGGAPQGRNVLRGPRGCACGWVWQAVGGRPGSVWGRSVACSWVTSRKAAGPGEWPGCRLPRHSQTARAGRWGVPRVGRTLASPAWSPDLGGKPPSCGHRVSPVPWAPDPGQPGLDGGAAGLERAERCIRGPQKAWAGRGWACPLQRSPAGTWALLTPGGGAHLVTVPVTSDARATWSWEEPVGGGIRGQSLGLSFPICAARAPSFCSLDEASLWVVCCGAVHLLRSGGSLGPSGALGGCASCPPSPCAWWGTSRVVTGHCPSRVCSQQDLTLCGPW